MSADSLGRLLRDALDRRAGTGPTLDYDSIADKAAENAVPRASFAGVLRVAAMAAIVVAVVGLSFLLVGETGQAQRIAEATGELVDSLFQSSVLDGIEFAVADLTPPVDPLLPVIRVSDLF